ncbi:hypothetical protein [Lysobacter gummosus]|uniref:hypothetical protein n=1 Tax=Lysobacter gummosus TaxID=262324 RepID=UPI00363B8567
MLQYLMQAMPHASPSACVCSYHAWCGSINHLHHGATLRQPRRAQQDANPPNRHRIRASRHAYEQDLFLLKSVSRTGN